VDPAENVSVDVEVSDADKVEVTFSLKNVYE
jgi:hypothetical protein